MTPTRRNLSTVLIYVTVVIAMTWPLVLDPLGMHLSRQFDIYSSIWLAAIAPGVDLNLHTDLSGWPVGQELNRLDSWVFLAIAKALSPISDGRLAIAVVIFSGPVLSAWAAERFAARCLNARWPWSLLAGLAFGFSGLAGTALLEGHVYALLNPWLPLMAWAAWRGTEKNARWTHGAAAAAMWFLCLATSAYVGIVATLVGVTLLARAAWKRQLRWPVAGAVAAVGLPLGSAYVRLFLQTGSSDRIDTATAIPTEVVMSAGSATAASIMGWMPFIDHQRHSITPILGATMLALVLFAPFVLQKEKGWRTLAGLGVFALLLGFGPLFQLVDHDLDLPWALWPFHDIAAASFFRFPYRLLAVTSLCFGAVAALVATRLAKGAPRATAGLLLCAFVDVLFVSGIPFRTAQVPMTVPSVYEEAPPDLAVLEVFPRFLGLTLDWELYINNLSCSYQREHGRPLLNLCIGTAIQRGPRWVVSTWLINSALDDALDDAPDDAIDDAPDDAIDDASDDAIEDSQDDVALANIAEVLSSLGIGAVVLHPDLFITEHRDLLLDWLTTRLGPPSATDKANGEYVVMFVVPEAELQPSPEATQEARRQAYSELAAAYQ